MSQGSFQANNPYATFGQVAAIDAPVAERMTFIKRTYLHVALAVYAVVCLEWLFFTFLGETLAKTVFGTQFGWLIMLGVFMVVSHIAQRLANSSASLGVQYAALGMYVLAWSVILYPMLWLAQNFGGTVGNTGLGVLPVATGATLAIFALLTAVVFLTRKDFSFLGPALTIAGLTAMGAIAVSIIFGWNPGVWFSFAMIGFAACYILYDTSNVLHHYSTTQHVAASVALFGSLALLFWYVLQVVLSFANRD